MYHTPREWNNQQMVNEISNYNKGKWGTGQLGLFVGIVRKKYRIMRERYFITLCISSRLLGEFQCISHGIFNRFLSLISRCINDPINSPMRSYLLIPLIQIFLLP